MLQQVGRQRRQARRLFDQWRHAQPGENQVEDDFRLDGIAFDGAVVLLGEGEGARLVDIEAVLSGAYVSYRQRMIWLLSLGLMAVVGLVSLRHRALRPTLMALCPALLAAAGTVGILSLAGQQLNLLSLVALLMVVSMGVDYGVFLAETCARPNALRATHLSVFVAGVSTILGFGLLAFSDQPALFSIGSTAGLGVLLCLLLAPTTCTLLRPRTS